MTTGTFKVLFCCCATLIAASCAVGQAGGQQRSNQPSAVGKNWLKSLTPMPRALKLRDETLTAESNRLATSVKKGPADIKWLDERIAYLERQAADLGPGGKVRRTENYDAPVCPPFVFQQVTTSDPSELPSHAYILVPATNSNSCCDEKSYGDYMRDIAESKRNLVALKVELAKIQQDFDKVRLELVSLQSEKDLVNHAIEEAKKVKDVTYAKRIHFGPFFADPSLTAFRHWTREPDQGFQALPITGEWLVVRLADGTIAWLPKTDAACHA